MVRDVLPWWLSQQKHPLLGYTPVPFMSQIFNLLGMSDVLLGGESATPQAKENFNSNEETMTMTGSEAAGRARVIWVIKTLPHHV